MFLELLCSEHKLLLWSLLRHIDSNGSCAAWPHNYETEVASARGTTQSLSISSHWRWFNSIHLNMCVSNLLPGYWLSKHRSKQLNWWSSWLEEMVQTEHKGQFPGTICGSRWQVLPRESGFFFWSVWMICRFKIWSYQCVLPPWQNQSQNKAHQKKKW